ncbi:hypothetical protein CROQUDRAFT_663995 [Cronartium quercuum f. sp. fusiforme G11]|uniref:Uncharacterized protein n=1 Tax=Cronartium quercuum f. sp. fusiforme G11 TaxID=708437 RepID=A0A9P6N7I2_9BASI|nr:hypothetical protein CROQUDRAFT_663995 [Cronartium quercuum f. sp. fusiforme G11]
MSLVNAVVTPAQVGLTSCHFPVKIVSAISEEGLRPCTNSRQRGGGNREMFSEG